MKHELIIELEPGVYGRLGAIAVRQGRLPVEVAEDAVGIYVTALAPASDSETISIELPVSTIDVWKRMAKASGRSVSQEIAIEILMRTIETIRDDRRGER